MSTTMMIIAIIVILYCAFMTLFLIGSAKQNKAYDKKSEPELKLYRVRRVYATAYDRYQAMRLISTHYASTMGDDYTEEFVRKIGIYDKHLEFEVIPEMCIKSVYNYFLALKDQNVAKAFLG